MAVKIRLKRLGAIRNPYYRIVVADARTKRDGRAIEEIGKYHPKAEPSVIEVNSDRVAYWLGVGAQPTEQVQHLLKLTGDWQKFKGEAGAQSSVKVAEPKADKKARYEELVKESFAAKEAAKKDTKPARSSRPKKDAEPAKDAESVPAAESAPAAEETEAPAEAAAETAAETSAASDGGSEA